MKARLFSGGLGINNKVVPHRLKFSKSTGVAAFENATDVLIDRTGEIVTRRGSLLEKAGDFHSRFVLGDGSFYLAEKRDDDCAIFKATPNDDGTLKLAGLVSGLPRNARIDFVEVGNRILYCTGSQNGVFIDDVSSSWDSQDWTGPDSNTEMVAPPIGSHLDFLSGRALVSKDDELFYSEHGLIGLIDEAKNRVRFESKVTMICAVQTGAFISDLKYVYFVSGTDPNNWLCKKVLNYPAIEWGREQGLVDPSFFGFETNELSVLFATVNGPVVGLPSGAAINLIDKNLTMPDCSVQSGSIMCVDETTIIQSGA